jgi:hypothetical protein
MKRRSATHVMHPLFKVGTSLTTGRQNCTGFKGPHLKTERVKTDDVPYGYPDPDYLQRVEQELAARGFHVARRRSF